MPKSALPTGGGDPYRHNRDRLTEKFLARAVEAAGLAVTTPGGRRRKKFLTRQLNADYRDLVVSVTAAMMKKMNADRSAGGRS